MHTTTILHGQNDLTMILARSSQDLPNSQDHGHDVPMWDLSVQFYIGGTHTVPLPKMRKYDIISNEQHVLTILE